MRTTLLVFALAISGISGNLQAAKHHSAHSAHSHKPAKAGKASKARRGKTGATQRLSRIFPQTFQSKGLSAHPMPPLPETPALGPASWVHLERVLPMDVRLDPPGMENPDRSSMSSMSAVASPALANLRPVLPAQPLRPLPGATDDLGLAPLSGPLGFELADRNSLDLLWPVETRTVSSAWGPRMRSKSVRVKARKRRVKYRGSHKGVDLSAPLGADVFAAMDGQVVASGRHRQYGNFVVLDHGNGVMTLYAHHNRNYVKEGDMVRRGQKIAEVGRTGNATGPHLHFELRLDGMPQNPLPYLNDVEEIPADMVAQNQAAVAPSSSR